MIMCGIVAIAGKAQVATRLVDGLKRLEYRGYDSALVLRGSHQWTARIERRRAEGQAAHSPASAACMSQPVAGLHWHRVTRAGRRTASPDRERTRTRTQLSGGVAVVHNGIIENYRELREGLRQAKGAGLLPVRDRHRR
jgi:glucosamine--fructose-6-phosphate aminotransferase (isomerizing)